METLYKVTWIDACTFDNMRESRKNLPLRISVGYLIREDADCIALCYLKDILTDDGMLGATDESEGIVIPRAWIKKMERFEITDV